MIKKLDAICLLVENLASSQAFYEEMLGLKIKSTDTGFVEYELSETPLALFEKQHAIAMFPGRYMTPSGGAVIALLVDDVVKTCDTLKSKGVVIFEGPKDTSWGQSVAYLHDPDNNIIEITSY